MSVIECVHECECVCVRARVCVFVSVCALCVVYCVCVLESVSADRVVYKRNVGMLIVSTYFEFILSRCQDVNFTQIKVFKFQHTHTHTITLSLSSERTIRVQTWVSSDPNRTYI